MRDQKGGNAGRKAPSLLRQIVDSLNGYDFFISYTRRPSDALPSGEHYANLLSQRLEQEGFRCFLDRKDFAPGDRWQWLVERKLRMTSQLIVVASPRALDVPAVVHEVEVFSRKDASRIIPIDFGGTIKNRDPDKPFFQHLPEQVLFLEESTGTLTTGPSDETVRRLKAGFDLTRQDSKRARAYATAAMVFALVGVIAIIGGVLAKLNEDLAEKKAVEATRNLIQSYNVQGTEASEQGETSEAAAYLSKSLKESLALEGVDHEPVVMRLVSMLQSGRFVPMEALLEHQGIVTGAKFSPAGDYLLTAADDDKARLWRRVAGDWTRVGPAYPHHADHPQALVFSQDGNRFATVFDGMVKVHETASGAQVNTFSGFSQPVGLLAFSRSGNSLFVGLMRDDDPGPARIIDLASGEILNPFRGSGVQGAEAIWQQVGPLGRTAVVGEQLVSLEPPFEAKAIPDDDPDGDLYGQFAFVPSHGIAFLDNFGIKAVDIETLAEIPIVAADYELDSVELFGSRSMGSVALDRSGRIMLREEIYALTGERFQYFLAAFEYSAPDYVDPSEHLLPGQRGVWLQGAMEMDNRTYRLSPGGRYLAADAGRGALELLDTLSQETLSARLRHPGPVQDVAFNDNETLLLTTAGDHYARIWDLSLLRAMESRLSDGLPSASPRWIPDVLFLDQGQDAYAIEQESLAGRTRSSDDRRVTEHRSPSGNWTIYVNVEDAYPRATSKIELRSKVDGRSFRFELPGLVVGTGFHPSEDYFYVQAHTHSGVRTLIGNLTTGETVLEGEFEFLSDVPGARRGSLMLLENGAITARDLATGDQLFPPIPAGGGDVVAVQTDTSGDYVGIAFGGDSSDTSGWAEVWHLPSGTRVADLDHGVDWDPVFLDGSSHTTDGTQAVVDIAFSSDSRYVATLSARQQIDGDRSYMGWQPRRMRVWELESGLPVSEWIDLNPRQHLPEADATRLGYAHEDAEQYVRPLSIHLEGTDDTSRELELRIGDEPIQRIELKPAIEPSALIDLTEALTGLRFNDEQARLVLVPEQERVAIWKALIGLPDVRELLEAR